MSENLSWVLTDVENRIYVEDFSINPSVLGPRAAAGCGGGWSVTKTRLKGGVSDGVDVIDVNNGRLSFTVIPTRGMGFWHGSCDGNFIGWDSPARFPVHPNQINILEQGGLGWLKGFNECVVRCGCNSNGAPGIDRVRDNNGNIAEVMLTLHGKIALTPACYVKIEIIPGDPAEIVITGVMEESRCFCPQYRLTTRYSTFVGSNKLSFKDQVLNFADSPTEFMMLYHCNFGSPYLEGGSTMVAPVLEIGLDDGRARSGNRAARRTGGGGHGHMAVVSRPRGGICRTVLFCRYGRACRWHNAGHVAQCGGRQRHDRPLEQEPAAMLQPVEAYDRIERRLCDRS